MVVIPLIFLFRVTIQVEVEVPVGYPMFNVTWEPTYNMSRSTITNPTGGAVGDPASTLSRDAKFGIVAFDGGSQACMNYRLGPPEDPCMYAKTRTNLEDEARRIKAINPDTHVWHYINGQLRLTRNEFDCPKMYDPSFAGFFLHNRDGSFLNTTAPFDADWQDCHGTYPTAKYPNETVQYYLDWRNESAQNWWLDVQLGSVINSTVVDGFYWDDPVFGNEGMWIRDAFTPAELADIDNHMQATRLEGYKRLSRGGGFCTGSTCYKSPPDVADCRCVGVDSNCTCNYSPESIVQNVQAAEALHDTAVLHHVAYAYEYHNPDHGPTDVSSCSGPAIVQSVPADPTHVPHSVQLSCLPGTGTMVVDFASFGLPNVGGGDPRAFWNKTADCTAFAANASCDAGPAVLQQLKALCDGKQSCRFNTSHAIFQQQPPHAGCGNVPLSSLRLAARASGCQFGTGSGIVFNFREQLAMFLLARGDHWWMGNDWIAYYEPVMLPEWEVDYGTPLNTLTLVDGVFSRKWSKMDIRLDTNTFEATFDSVTPPPASACASTMAGEWTSGWPADYDGASTTQPPAPKGGMVLRHAETPWGNPRAQYVVDYESALAVHPNMQTCLGNGTCSANQFGTSRALNSTTPGCTFIEWPSALGGPTNMGWCKVPFCGPAAPPPPVPPPPPYYPPFNLTWKPTYVMNRSTIANPTGNLTGYQNAQARALDGKFGIITFDGGTMSCLNQRRYPSTGVCNSQGCDACKYAKTVTTAEEQARRIKATDPSTHVWTYRNMQLGLSRNEHDCPKMYNPEWSGFWLQDKKSGKPLNLGKATQGDCDAVAPASDYGIMDSYYLDWRNATAREWWLDVKLGSLINSTNLDGFYWDDPTFGNEQESIRDNFNATELVEIDYYMQKTRLEGYMRLSAAGKFCTGSTCFHGVGTPFDCKCSGAPWGLRNLNCTCVTPAAKAKSNLLTMQAQSTFPSFLDIPLPNAAVDTVVHCPGPAAAMPVSTDKTLAPGVMQLSCLPGTGTMSVDFASLGRPSVGSSRSPSGPSINCAAFKTSSTGCDAGPAVLARIKSLCDGKQSCRINTTDPIFAMLPPNTPGCNNGNATDPLQLAVRATGCARGTGGGERAWFREALAGFLLTRGDHWWMGFGWIATHSPIYYPEWDVDYGVPLGPMTVEGNVATRQWTKISVRLNLDTMEADFAVSP